MASRKKKKTISAGGVVLDARGRVALVSQRGNSWSLPKGHLEGKESPLEAAHREIYEETGLSELTYLNDLGSYQRYRIGKGGAGEDRSELKTMVFYLFTTSQTELSPQDEKHPEAKWVPPQDVAPLLTHQKDREFFVSILDRIRL